MNKFMKLAAAAGVAGGLALTAGPPSRAQDTSSAAVTEVGYFGPDYTQVPGDTYAPGYTYAPAAEAYAYAPPQAPGNGAYAYVPAPAYAGSCWISTYDSKGYGYYGSCFSQQHDLDAETLGQARPNKSLSRP